VGARQPHDIHRRLRLVVREASERQTSSDSAYGRARELARTAQFMREWSSGTQTDFTNYAARRLAERGLLREEDPIKLQRAVTEIAYSYARGGSSATGYVPSDSPLGPSRPLPEAMGWPDQPCASSTTPTGARRTALHSANRPRNESEIRARQTRQRAAPGQGGGQRPGRSRRCQRSRNEGQDRQGSHAGLAGRRNAQRELQGLGARRQDQPQPRRQPSGLGHGRRQREPARTSAHRPRSSRSANGTSGRTACP
jgi:hypothetical protein